MQCLTVFLLEFHRVLLEQNLLLSLAKQMVAYYTMTSPVKEAGLLAESWLGEGLKGFLKEVGLGLFAFFG